MTLPPGPELPALAQAVAYHRDPLGVLLRARARYGPEFTLRVTKPIVFVSDPALRADANAGEARRTVLPLASPLNCVLPMTAVGLPLDSASSRLIAWSAHGGAAVHSSEGSLTSWAVSVFERIAGVPIIGADPVAFTSNGDRITWRWPLRVSVVSTPHVPGASNRTGAV